VSFQRCHCGHYNDVHDDRVGVCRHVHSNSWCACTKFRGRGDAPEGADHGPEPRPDLKSIAKPGYHLATIAKGELGELSKIQEELDELRDAEAQGVKIMALVEASDLIGAIDAWLAKHHPQTTLADLVLMHEVTRRAFENGRRK